MAKISPVGEMVLIKDLEENLVTASGLVLTTDLNRYLVRAEVIEVGPGELDKKGNRLTPEVRIGDIVHVPSYGGDTIMHEGVDYRLIREADIALREKT